MTLRLVAPLRQWGAWVWLAGLPTLGGAQPVPPAPDSFYVAPVPIVAPPSTQLSLLAPLAPLGMAADSLGRWAVPGMDVAHALARLPGVAVRDYGGHGAVQTISLRGFATNQTTLTINDVPYAQNGAGVVNLGNFYLQGFTTVGIQPAAPPTQNPLGGNLSLSTLTTAGGAGRAPLPSLSGTASALAGSFGEWGATVGGRAQVAPPPTPHPDTGLPTPPPWHLSVAATATALAAREDYPYRLNGESGTRAPAHFGNLQVLLHPHVSWQPTPAHTRHGLHYVAVGNARSTNIPGAVVTGNPTPLGEAIRSTNLFQYVQWEAETPTHRATRWHTDLTLRHQTEGTHYQFASLATRYTLHDALLMARATRTARHTALGALADATLTLLESPSLVIAQRAASQVNRRVGSGAVWALGRLPLGQGWQLGGQAQARANHTNRYGTRLNPLVRAWARKAIGPRTAAQLHLQAQEGHRLPSFNELYYFGYGNEALRPERARQAEAGLSLAIDPAPAPRPSGRWLEQLALSAIAFANQTRDKIVAVPLSPVRWSTQQLGLARSHGAEFALEASLAPARHTTLSPRASLTLLQARDYSLTNGAWLPYTPGYILAASLEARWRWLSAALWAQHLSGRFASLQNDRYTYLPPFAVLDAWAQAQVRLPRPAPHRPLWLSLRVSAQNAASTSYVYIQSYPMPPLRMRATLGFFW
jgi:outer membrane cobalamin receptor